MTEGRIKAAPPPVSGVRYDYDVDVPGLALRVTCKDVRTFVFVKKIAGRAQRITLGRWPGLRLAMHAERPSASMAKLRPGLILSRREKQHARGLKPAMICGLCTWLTSNAQIALGRVIISAGGLKSHPGSVVSHYARLLLLTARRSWTRLEPITR